MKRLISIIGDHQEEKLGSFKMKRAWEQQQQQQQGGEEQEVSKKKEKKRKSDDQRTLAGPPRLCPRPGLCEARRVLLVHGLLLCRGRALALGPLRLLAWAAPDASPCVRRLALRSSLAWTSAALRSSFSASLRALAPSAAPGSLRAPPCPACRSR